MDGFTVTLGAVLPEQDNTFPAEVDLITMHEQGFFISDLEERTVGTAINQNELAPAVFDTRMVRETL